MVYYFIYFLAKFISIFLFPRRIYGQENIPRQGPVIFASNHVSNLDPVVLGISCVRRLNFMAKHSLFSGFFGWVLVKLGAFPVKRGEADFGALKEACKRLNKKKPLLIFVEGTRQIGDAPSQAQPGVGFLAAKTKAQVIPVYIEGTDKVMPAGSKILKRHPVTVRFGAPLSLDLTSSYQSIADRILKQIYFLSSAH